MSVGPAGPEVTFVGLLNRKRHRPSTSDWAPVLAQLPLFARVSKRHLRRVAALAEIREFESGDTIVEKGDAPDGFYLILGGRAKVVARAQPRPLKTGDYFGEMALLDGEPRSATVVAVGNLQTMRLPRRPFMRLLQPEPSIAIAILAELGSRVRRLEKSRTA